MPRFLISFRPEDADAAARRIHARLAAHFGPNSVLTIDNAAPPGEDLRSHVPDVVAQCQAVVLVIGDCWLDARYGNGHRRIDDPDDPVRIEIEAALNHGVPVIPVLAGWSSMPRETALPESLSPLARWPAVEVRPTRNFHRLVDRLIRRVERILEAVGEPTAEGPPESADRSAALTPRGLRPFDSSDAEAFLRLLPGGCDAAGLPPSVRFWKARIEETEAGRTFSLGLLYGPSGSGKTSLLRAGILPRLPEHVSVVAADAATEQVEQRLFLQLQAIWPDMPFDYGLTEALAAIKGGEGIPARKKLLIVVDHFEQWLLSHQDYEKTELVTALRRIDGGRVQCVLAVREDAWVATSRFMEFVKVDLVSGHNVWLCDPLDESQARSVLAEFGPASEKPDEDTDHEEFLAQTVSALSRRGKVLPVQIALFAEIVKAKPWLPDTLSELGDLADVGLAFLEAAFGKQRRHQHAARAALEALLPNVGEELSHAARSHQELLAASGYARRPRKFEELLHLLEKETALISRVDRSNDADDASSETADPLDTSYQLTHDFIVPSVRAWLAKKGQETWRSRAEALLSQRAATWSGAREKRNLPSLFEYLNLVFGVPRRKRQDDQRQLMRAAFKYHAQRWGIVMLCGILLLGFAVYQYAPIGVGGTHAASDSSPPEIVEDKRSEAEKFVDALMSAPAEAIPYITANLRPLGKGAVPLLKERFAEKAIEPTPKLHLAFGLAACGEVGETFLIDAIRTAPGAECRNFVDALRGAKDSAVSELKKQYEDVSQPAIKTRLAIVLLHLGDTNAAADAAKAAPDPVHRTAFVHGFARWHGDLAKLPDIVQDTDDASLRSGLAAALGTIPADELRRGELNPLQAMVAKWFQDAPDGGTHSAAAWTLRQWQIELPAIESSAGPPTGRQWYVNGQGMTMLRIPLGKFTMGSKDVHEATPHEVTLSRAFELCATEVTVEQYQRFLDDQEYPQSEKPERPIREKEVSPSDDCPISNVTVNFHAIAFCNWLSKTEELTPCYERTGEKVRGKDAWRCNFDADGYRLPTEAEWEYACRAGTATAFSFGDDPSWLPRYSVFLANAHGRTRPPGSKLPGAWGLFDMHGNVSELCQDWYAVDAYATSSAKDPVGPASGRFHVMRGGAFSFEAKDLASPVRSWRHPFYRDDAAGFRVARTVK